MGNKMDSCYNCRWSYQCIFPCIRFCTYTGRRVWYNFDGTEMVQPLVHVFHPEDEIVHSLPSDLYGINEDSEINNQLIHTGLDSPGQLAAVCKYATDRNYTIRAVGTGSSWSRLTHTRDIMVNMTSLERILTPEPMSRMENMNKENVEIEVQGGMRVADFVEQLDTKYGLALDMMGNYAGQTVAGVANTSTHGSGIFRGTMSTLVVGLHLIISGGIQVKVRGGDETIEDLKPKITSAKYGDDPVEINSDDVLKACAVGLGSMGIVYSITYRCVPMYNLAEKRVMAYADWTSADEFKIPDKFKDIYAKSDQGEYFSFFVNPYRMPSDCGSGGDEDVINMVYLQAKRTKDAPTCCLCCMCCCSRCGGRGIAEIGCLQTDCTASCLQSCANCCPTYIPRLTNCGLEQFKFDNPEDVFVQKWYNVLQFTKGNIHVRTAEFCLPLEHLNRALGMVIEMAREYAKWHQQYSLLPIYVRLVKTDDLFLSPASKFRPDETTNDHNCYIEVPFLPGAFGIDEFQETVENALFEKFKARPHWGKNNKLNEVKIRSCYNWDKIKKWVQVFQMFNGRDKRGPFTNRFTHYMGFEDSRILVIDVEPTGH